MPYSILLQNWVRIGGATSAVAVAQDEAQWLDIGPFTGLVVWMEAGFFGGSPVIDVQSSPTHEESHFKTMGNAPGKPPYASYAPTTSGVLPVFAFTFDDVTNNAPPSKWLRWRATGGANWRVAFRIWLTGIQGRGGALKHARVLLPREAHAHADDHTHAAQAELGRRAAAHGRTAEGPRRWAAVPESATVHAWPNAERVLVPPVLSHTQDETLRRRAAAVAPPDVADEDDVDLDEGTELPALTDERKAELAELGRQGPELLRLLAPYVSGQTLARARITFDHWKRHPQNATTREPSP
jgi:hypothetical protein